MEPMEIVQRLLLGIRNTERSDLLATESLGGRVQYHEISFRTLVRVL